MEDAPYTIDGSWEGLCAAILVRALLDACGDLELKQYKGNGRASMQTYGALRYPVAYMRSVNYLSGCNGDLVKEDLHQFFSSRYARIIVDGASVGAGTPIRIWRKVRGCGKYRKSLKKRLSMRRMSH